MNPARSSETTFCSIAPMVAPISADGNSNLQVAYSENTDVILGFSFSYIPRPLHQEIVYPDYDHFSSLF